MKRDPKVIPDPICFTVPGIPVSVNHYVKHTRNGRHYQVSSGKEFKKSVGLFARGARMRWKAYEVHITIFLGYKQSGDIDNFAKCPIDGLKQSGVIDTDAKITSLVMRKFRDISAPRTEIKIFAATL